MKLINEDLICLTKEGYSKAYGVLRSRGEREREVRKRSCFKKDLKISALFVEFLKRLLFLHRFKRNTKIVDRS